MVGSGAGHPSAGEPGTVAMRWGALRRFVQRWSRSAADIDSAELLDTATRVGATPIADLEQRVPGVAFGEIRSVALRPQVQVPALVVEVSDGTGTLEVVWLGRREIVGIEPGVTLRVHGRTTQRRGIPVMFNPSYEIIPARG
jgi:hypothetical protein